MEGSGHGLIQGTISVCLDGLRKPTETLSGQPTEYETRALTTRQNENTPNRFMLENPIAKGSNP